MLVETILVEHTAQLSFNAQQGWNLLAPRVCHPIDPVQLVVSELDASWSQPPQLLLHDGELGTVAKNLGIAVRDTIRVVTIEEGIDWGLESL